MQFQHQNNTQQGEFFHQTAEGKRLAEISYQWLDEQTIAADHTWVDDSLRGQGVARQLLDVLVEFARQHQLKIVPQCSYVVTMFQREASFKDVALLDQ